MRKWEVRFCMDRGTFRFLACGELGGYFSRLNFRARMTLLFSLFIKCYILVGVNADMTLLWIVIQNEF